MGQNNLKKITEEMYEALKAGFPEEAYSAHPTKSFLTVLKAYYVTERLNEVFGVGRWRIATEVVERTEDYIVVKGRFESMDYEVMCTEQYGGHKTAGTNAEIADGFKSAVTDCQSKIASYLGVGHELFKGKIRADGKDPKSQKLPRKNKVEYNPEIHTLLTVGNLGTDKFKNMCRAVEAKGGGYQKGRGFFVPKEVAENK